MTESGTGGDPIGLLVCFPLYPHVSETSVDMHYRRRCWRANHGSNNFKSEVGRPSCATGKTVECGWSVGLREKRRNEDK
ncbi:hypothetical protein FOZ61_009812 [Perkinsus olseni]|uniref:Uncharacterized protein n=1 Tax=Perkinsus olseni TaxID=32597 RepID=A0A7J6KZD1_PEROL|nr:hypothetical protein FOZ61_009812 [Perkinsus olseni]